MHSLFGLTCYSPLPHSGAAALRRAALAPGTLGPLSQQKAIAGYFFPLSVFAHAKWTFSPWLRGGGLPPGGPWPLVALKSHCWLFFTAPIEILQTGNSLR